MIRHKQILLVCLLSLVMAACGGRDKIQENPGGSRGGSGGSGKIDAEVQAYMDKNGITSSGRYDLSNPLSNKTIYFEYDSSSVDPESQMIVEFHAKHLASTSATASLEGHADESGTREYNLALGERRGQTVQSIMFALDSSGNDVVSYGEEKPISTEFWENRRVEIIY